MINNVKKFSKDNSQIIIFFTTSLVVFITSFFISVLLTNSINQESFGMFKYVTNFLLLVPTVMSLGIHFSTSSIVARHEKNESSRIIGAAIILMLFISTVTTILLYLINLFGNLFGVILLDNLIFFFPFLIIFFLQLLIDQVYTGLGEVIKLSLFSLIPNIIKIILLLIFINLFKNIDGFIALMIFVFSHFVVVMPRILSTKISFKNLNKFINLIMIDLKKNGLFIYFSSIFTSVITQVIALITANLYGFSTYGYYSLAVSLAIAFQMIGSSVAVARFRKNASLDKIPINDFQIMMSISLISYLLFYFFIDYIFFWFYPLEYGLSVFYLKLLAISNLIYGSMLLFNRFFIGKGMGKVILRNSIITGTVSILFTTIFVYLFQLNGIVYSSIITSLFNLTLYILSYKNYLNSINKKDVQKL